MSCRRDDGSPPRAACSSCAGKHSTSCPARQRFPRTTRTTSCASLSIWARAMVAPRSPTPTAGGSTPSEPAFAPEERAPRLQRGHQHLDNCRGIVEGPVATPALHMRVIPDWSARPKAGGGREAGSYPGRDWVRGPGRAPRRRSSASSSTGPSSRRSRVQVPSTALCPWVAVGSLSTWPNGQGTGLRSRRVQVRALPSTQHLAVAQ